LVGLRRPQSLSENQGDHPFSSESVGVEASAGSNYSALTEVSLLGPQAFGRPAPTSELV